VPPLDLPGPAKSVFPTATFFQQNEPLLAYSAIGQDDVQATPLEMALIAGAIADGGTIMTPHVLDQVTNAQGQIVSTYQPRPWLHAASAATASQVTKLMLSVVNCPQGTGVAAHLPNIQVAGKTGTAQTGTGLIDAWFAAFAPAANPSIAVAVVLPNQPSANEFQGGTLAAPIAKAMIQAYLTGGTKGAASNGGAAPVPPPTCP
jgi:peptidoglycan glycosyltransferase